MADRLAWYRMFPRDFRESRRTRQLTANQRRLYREMLDEQWIDGPLPDAATVAKILEADVNDARTVLERCFKQTPTGWSNERMEQERVNAEEWIKKSARGGKASGKSRRASGSKQPSTTVEPPLNTPPTPTPPPVTHVSLTDGTPDAAQAGCPLNACDGSGAVKARGGRILRCCECPEGRRRSQRFATLCAADEKAKAKALPAEESGPLAEAARALAAAKAIPADEKPEQSWPCRRCQAVVTEATRRTHKCRKAGA